MSNEFYLHTTYPTPNSPGSSANLRAELESIEAGFEKMPALTGQGGKVVAVNTGGTALESTSNVAGLAITGGSINNTPIGATTANTGTFTTATATTGFVGNLTGNVGGNLTGNVTSSGTSTFNNVTISGSLDMNSSTASTITGLSAPSNGSDATTKSYVDSADALKLNLSGGTMSGAIAMASNGVTGLPTPSNTSDAATKGYVDTSISNLIASAPGTLDTLNELATALGNDPSFATTVTNSIATKLPLAGGTMTGAIAMGTNKITDLGTPTLSADATTKTYVDTADALKLNLSGGTMSGVLNMGSQKITALADPTVSSDAVTLNYVTTLYGSTAAAAASAIAAQSSADTAAANAGASASNASAAASSAATALGYLDTFRGQYYGPASSDPALDPVGNAPTNGDLYFNTASNLMKAYNGSAWQVTYNPGATGTVSSVDVSGGTTGLTTSGGPITSSGTITLGGTLAIANGGTGATAATGSGNVVLASSPTLDNPTYTGTLTGGTGVVNIGSGQVYKDASGNLLVGETSAGYSFSNRGLIELNGTSSALFGLRVGAANKGYLLHEGTNLFLSNDANGATVFNTNATERMRLDDSGNLGLGITPSAWGSSYKAIQNPAGGIGAYSTSSVAYAQNAYDSAAGAWKYLTTGIGAGFYNQSLGTHAWYTAPSGTAGNAISFTQAMTLDASGNLNIANLTASKAVFTDASKNLTTTGTLGVDQGGTGAATLTGVLKGNGTSAFTAASAGTDYVAPGSATTSGLTMSTARMLGRTTASSGAVEEITIGSGLTLSGGSLTATGTGGTVTSVSASVPSFLSVSGSPVTTTGTLAITYSGTALPVANGGTGATSAGAALTALGAFPIAGGTLTGTANFNATQTIASATTTDIGAATSNQVIISGTTTITGLGTIAAGATRWVTFSGALTLTHDDVSLILPGNTSRATAAGDSAVFVSLGSGNWRCTAYQRAVGFNATLTGSEILTNKTIQAATFTNGYTEETVTANTSTAYTIDLVNGTVQILTLTGNCVYTFPTATAGRSFLLIQKQDATGSRTVTWPSVTNPVKWPASTAPTITSTASKADVFAFTADGTNWYGRVIGQNYL